MPSKRLKRQFPWEQPLKAYPSVTFIPQSPTWTKFLKMSCADGKELARASPFFLQKAITAQIGQPKKIKKLRDGSLLIEAATESQSEKAQSCSLLGGKIEVICKPHPTLNTKKGIIHCPELDSDNIEDIKTELSGQGVEEVRRITRKNNVLSHLYILHFKTHSLPKELKVGYLNVLVKPYIPSPIRCYKCLRLGHHKDVCRSRPSCHSCGYEDTDGHSCGTERYCINCDSSHSPWDRSCPSWLRERRIRELQVTRDVPLREARRLYRSLLPDCGLEPPIPPTSQSSMSTTFASVCRTPSVTLSSNSIPPAKPKSPDFKGRTATPSLPTTILTPSLPSSSKTSSNTTDSFPNYSKFSPSLSSFSKPNLQPISSQNKPSSTRFSLTYSPAASSFSHIAQHNLSSTTQSNPINHSAQNDPTTAPLSNPIPSNTTTPQ